VRCLTNNNQPASMQTISIISVLKMSTPQNQKSRGTKHKASHPSRETCPSVHLYAHHDRPILRSVEKRQGLLNMLHLRSCRRRSVKSPENPCLCFRLSDCRLTADLQATPANNYVFVVETIGLSSFKFSR